MRTQERPPVATARPVMGALAATSVLLAALATLGGLADVAASTSGNTGPLSEDTGLQIDVSVQPTVRPGNELEYAVHYTNTSSAAFANVRIRCALSTGQSFDGAYRSVPAIGRDSFEWSDLEMGWSLASLSPGASGEILLSTVAESEPEPSSEQAVQLLGISAQIGTNDLEEPLDEDSAVAQVVGPILEVDVGGEPNPVTAGFPVTYTLVVANLDRSDAMPASGVVVTNVLPEHTVFQGAGDGGSYDDETGLVRWELAEIMEPGTTKTLWFRVQVDPLTPAGTKIVNDRAEYGVICSELKQGGVRGRRRLSTRVTGLLTKAGQGQRVYLNSPAAYPSENITFTLRIKNYLNMPIHGVRITDTLPAYPDPLVFVSVADGGSSPVVDGAVLLWDGISIEPRGESVRTYVVRVPNTIKFSPNSYHGNDLASQLAADHPDVEFGPAGGEGGVRILPPVVLEVSATPSLLQSGNAVTYTLALQNRAPFPITGIRITDTIEGTDFRYSGMKSGPAPEPMYNTNPIVWSGLSVPADTTLELVFSATAVGLPLAIYRSNLSADSPDARIPLRTNRAGVRIDSPFTVSKIVSPENAMMGDTVQVNVGITSITTSTWGLSRVVDRLPEGFYDVASGQQTVITELEPPFQLSPGNDWKHSYDMLVSYDLSCACLPARYVTHRGEYRMEFVTPVEGAYVNAGDMGPIVVAPHVSAELVPLRPVVFAGYPAEYLLVLENDSLRTADEIDLHLAVPPDFHYVASLSGQAPVQDENILLWSGLALEPGARWESKFRMLAGTDTGRRGFSLASETADPTLCVQHLENAGLTQVVNDVGKIMTLAVTPRQRQASPGAAVDFDVVLQSKVNQTYSFDAVTSTLPAGFEYVGMISGDKPVERGSKLVWSGIEVPGRSRYVLRYRAVAPPLFGSYAAGASAHTPDLPLLHADGEAVSVVPLVQISKAASPTVSGPGATIAYTISLVNVQNESAVGIDITDTLPAQFQYVRVISGPAPSSLGDGLRRPSWSDLAVPRGGVKDLVFEVMVKGDAPAGVYYNRVDASAPNALLPGTDNTAPVTITHGLVTPGPSPVLPTARPTDTPRSPSATPPGPTSTPRGPTITPGGPTLTPSGPDATPSTRTGWIYLPFAWRGR